MVSIEEVAQKFDKRHENFEIKSTFITKINWKMTDFDLHTIDRKLDNIFPISFLKEYPQYPQLTGKRYTNFYFPHVINMKNNCLMNFQ